MAERVYFRDGSGNPFYDPESSGDKVTNLSFDTEWPKGYTVCSFDIVRDIRRPWQVKNGYEVFVKHGQKILFQGRIQNIKKSLVGLKMVFNVQVFGYYQILILKLLRWRWIDANTWNDTFWITTREENADQQRFAINKTTKLVKAQGGYDDTTRAGTEEYWERYFAAAGNYVDRMTADRASRAGNSITFEIYNVDQAATEVTLTASGESEGTVTTTPDIDHTFTQGDTIKVSLRFLIDDAAQYDENDWLSISNLVTYFALQDASTNYTNGNLVEDVLRLKGSEISADYDGLTDPGLTINPFTTLNDGNEALGSIINRLLGYGDSSNNHYGFLVWDETGTSDGLPKAFIELKPVTTDYDYEVFLGELSSFEETSTLDEVYNFINVKYLNDRELVRYNTPDDEATLKDQTSIDAYGQRDYVLDIGKGDATDALNYGKRFLAEKKDPQSKGRFSIAGNIRKKGGAWIPASWVRAGKRLRIADYENGKIFLIRHTSYNAETKTLDMEPDLPPDSVQTLLSQLAKRRELVTTD